MRVYLIWSIEHDMWWRPGRMGYTRVLAEAGRYEEREAREILQQANLVAFHECLIPLECLTGGVLAPHEQNAEELERLRVVMRALGEAFGR